MKINEIFRSLQGEGLHTGRPAVFIRTYGCNLNCPWCDTEYAMTNANYTEMKPEEILSKVQELSPIPVVAVLTGGEPMIHWDAEMLYLLRLLQTAGYETHIETNGTVATNTKYVDFLSISPKLNHDLDKIYKPSGLSYFESIKSLCNSGVPYQLKFVIQEPNDIMKARELIDCLSIPSDALIVLQPERYTFESMAITPTMTSSTISDQEERSGYSTTYDPDTGTWTTVAVSRIVYLDNLQLLMKWAESHLASYNYRVLPQLHYLMWEGRRGV